MSYQTILVNIDLDGPVAPIVTLATDMARRCKSKLVGYCAANAPMATLLSPEGDVLTYELWQQRRREIEQKLKELHSGFRAVVGSAVRAEWRYAMGNPTSCLASAARLADLIITNAPQGAASGDEYHSIDPGTPRHAGWQACAHFGQRFRELPRKEGRCLLERYARVATGGIRCPSVVGRSERGVNRYSR